MADVGARESNRSFIFFHEQAAHQIAGGVDCGGGDVGVVGVPVNAIALIEADGEAIDGIVVYFPAMKAAGVACIVASLSSTPVVVGGCVRLPQAVAALRLLESGFPLFFRNRISASQLSLL